MDSVAELVKDKDAVGVETEATIIHAEPSKKKKKRKSMFFRVKFTITICFRQEEVCYSGFAKGGQCC